MPSPVAVFFTVALLQAIALIIDESYCHHRRGLPVWEKRGHAADTFFFAMPFFALAMNGSEAVFFILAVLSCAIILKDEWVHAGRIDGLESFLHAFLFVIHPLTLLSAYWVSKTELEGPIWWWMIGLGLLSVSLAQISYWTYWGPSPKFLERRQQQ